MSGTSWRDEFATAEQKEFYIRNVLHNSHPKKSQEYRSDFQRLRLIGKKNQTPKAGGKFAKVQKYAEDAQRLRALVGKSLVLTGTIDVSNDPTYRRASTVTFTQRALDAIPGEPWLVGIVDPEQRAWAAAFYDEVGHTVGLGADVSIRVGR